MKKLITILLTTFFICTASYGATIKELLKGQKSLELVCTSESVSLLWYKVDKELKEAPAWVGHAYIVNIKKNSFSIDDTRGFFHRIYKVGVEKSESDSIEDGILYETERWGSIGLNDREIDLLGFVSQVGNKHKTFDKSKIKISRLTGKFSYYNRQWSNTLDVFTNGTCEKVTDNKF